MNGSEIPWRAPLPTHCLQFDFPVSAKSLSPKSPITFWCLQVIKYMRDPVTDWSFKHLTMFEAIQVYLSVHLFTVEFALHTQDYKHKINASR